MLCTTCKAPTERHAVACNSPECIWSTAVKFVHFLQVLHRTCAERTANFVSSLPFSILTYLSSHFYLILSHRPRNSKDALNIPRTSLNMRCDVNCTLSIVCRLHLIRHVWKIQNRSSFQLTSRITNS